METIIPSNSLKVLNLIPHLIELEPKKKQINLFFILKTSIKLNIDKVLRSFPFIFCQNQILFK